MNDIAFTAIRMMHTGEIRKNSWGEMTAKYLLMHPEDGLKLAEHHWLSFLAKKESMRVYDILNGRHTNPITLHHLFRKEAKAYFAN